MKGKLNSIDKKGASIKQKVFSNHLDMDQLTNMDKLWTNNGPINGPIIIRIEKEVIATLEKSSKSIKSGKTQYSVENFHHDMTIGPFLSCHIFDIFSL